MARPNETNPQDANVAHDAGVAADTLRLIEHTKKLSQLNSRFEVALNNMARGLSMFDADRRLIVCNGLYREIYDLPEELTVPGTPFSKIVAYHSAKEGSANSVDDLKRQQLWIEQHATELRHGKVFTHTQNLKNGRIILVTNQPLEDGGWVDIQEDVTEKTLAQERIAWLARHCPLTEIANRFHFREMLDEEIQRLKPNGSLAVHLIDLDYFKQVNDTLGHAAGDAVLKAVAKRLRTTVRDNDLVGRLGGDEFAIIQTDISGPEQAASLALRLVSVLNAPYRVLGANAGLGASIGVAICPDHGADPDTLLRRADMALYRVKTCGRGSSYIYHPEDEQLVNERIELQADLAEALKKRQLSLHYQPIVDVEAGTVTGCEALMRWQHPKLGMVPPSTFIPIAERSGLILAMGEWALHQACRDAAGWAPSIRVAVNISAVQFDHGDPAAVVEEALAASGLAADRLEVEITESTLLRCETKTLQNLERLRARGVRLVLDDFGTGFASLSYLRNFSFDKIKIDRSFVADMAERRDCMAIVGAVTGLAKTLGIGPVAEGIEDIEQLTGVSIAGCREMQGFYFSRPVPSADVEDAVAQCLTRISEASGKPNAG
ncbi:putative bifunctional diguanylate cyclase/phosphodiesterase [Hyphomicrobium zavarzinii]|uniref:putative bifunctional diguanylate cyclase/phosphodiesterase n=1 Tax=Hyphomicrobium zavarzinii TaxID=48292 RepID=UPI00038053B7|nr:EAL domain-containing protein [Hyphomicrobium zavarzinii]